MSTFSEGIGPEEEDGAGWGGLVESRQEKAERLALDRAHLDGMLIAYAKAMTECNRPAQREGNSVGARDCSEIRTAIEILHLNVLKKIFEEPK